MIKEKKRMGKQVGRVPEGLPLHLSVLLCRRAIDNFVKPRKALHQKHSSF